GRHLARHEHRAHRRLFEIGRVAMPQPAEIDPLAFELDDRRDLGEAVDALDERVLDRLAEMPRQAEQFGRRQVLVAKEDHDMVEPGLADRRDGIVVELLREIDAEDLRADRSRQWANLEFVPGHAPFYRHAPGAPSRQPLSASPG